MKNIKKLLNKIWNYYHAYKLRKNLGDWVKFAKEEHKNEWNNYKEYIKYNGKCDFSEI